MCNNDIFQHKLCCIKKKRRNVPDLANYVQFKAFWKIIFFLYQEMWYCCFKNYVLLRNIKSILTHWFRAVYVNISLTSVYGSNPSGFFFFFSSFFGTILYLNIYVDITLCWTIKYVWICRYWFLQYARYFQIYC